MLTIRTKLLLAFAAIFIPMSVIWFSDYLVHDHLANDVTSMYTHPLAFTRASSKANSYIMQMRRAMKDVILASSNEEITTAVSIVDELEIKAFDQLAVVQEHIVGDEGKKLAASTYQVFKDWRAIRQKVIRLVQAGKRDEAIAITKGEGAEHVKLLDAKAEQLWKYAEKMGSAFNLEAKESVASMAQKDSITFIIIMLLSSLVGIYLSISISSRLGSLKAAAKKMAAGDLNQQVQIKGGDEIAELGEEFNLMALKLSKSYSSLEQEIAERKKVEEELLVAKETAEDATNLKDKFVSLVVHDLKSPFTAILGTMDLLSNDSSLNLSENQRRLMNSVLRSGKRMVSMIDKMLDVSRLKTGQIELTPAFLDARVLTVAVLEDIGFKPDEKGITIVNEVPEGSRLYADAPLFSEVIFNLLSNAIKFCGRGDTVTLFIPDGRPTTIALRDTGSGISDEMIPDLFKSEVKTTTIGSSGEVGTGLGLPYCYDIMKAHGGDITVDSAMGEGSVFYARLPDVRPRVLVVDDEAVVRQMLTLFLDDLKVDIIEADNGELALAVIEENRPHLILCDVNMPVMDGFTFLKKIKGDDAMKSIPIVIITSDDQLETREKVIRLGADDFISKPVKIEELIPRVRKHII